MNWLDLLALTLATAAIIDVWFNGSILAEWRADIEAIVTSETTVAPWWARLLNCAFCLSHHVSWILLLGIALDAIADVVLRDSPLARRLIFWAVRFPVYSLAVTFASNLLNRLLPETARYERGKLVRDEPDAGSGGEVGVSRAGDGVVTSDSAPDAADDSGTAGSGDRPGLGLAGDDRSAEHDPVRP